LLEHQAKRIPDAPAILAPGRPPLTYGRLYQHIETVERGLRGMGIGRHDRIAVVLPSGPEIAVAILTVAASAPCAPVNPAYGTEELDRYFEGLRPRALIAQAGIDTPARRIALSRGVRVIELSPALDAEAGLFTLLGDQGGAPSHQSISPGDIALLIPTSGTTSRPKIVPQTHAKVCASAYATSTALALKENDRCLNILPLFHGHGLIATVMASLAAGASVVCPPTFDAESFFVWLTAFQPTWYSAVPAMHHAIVGQARHNCDRLSEVRLRFVRSSSAPLPPRLFAELEQSFNTSVIEWYGMTEVAASPITCNPLPPRSRKPGSVGVPLALDVAIMDEGGALLASGQTGQVVVRGVTVMAGYDGDPMATEAAFVGDWFKTGDVGYFDEEGYLFLTGRIREMINRGGEKVAPREIDEVLLEHPAVAEAVTFAVPHATLGEDVAAAVVLRPHAAATAKEIRRFAAARVADFKVPRQVLLVEQIPKGPTGKVQRIGLAGRLGLASEGALSGVSAPRTPLEKAVAGVWAEVLGVGEIGVDEDFFALGGDSLSAARVVTRMHEVMDLDLEVSDLFEAPTVAEMARRLETLRWSEARWSEAPRRSSPIVPMLRENGAGPASIAQERLWEVQHALPDLPVFNILFALRLRSPLDPALLERSINAVVERHEVLRTTFAILEEGHTQVIASKATVSLRFEDVGALDLYQQETAVKNILQEEILHRFDLAKGPLFRTRLVRVAKGEHLFLISTHKLVCDGSSLDVFVHEVAAFHDAFVDGRQPALKPLPVQYADFAHWQRQWRSNPAIASQLAYWRHQLAEPLPAMRLARVHTENPSAEGKASRTLTGFQTARREVALPAALSQAARCFSSREGVTMFMTLTAAFKTLLHRLTGADDVRLATHVANRHRPGTEGLIGPVVNTMILRTDLGGDPSAREVLRRVRATTLAGFANQDIPIEVVVDALQRERGLKPAALAQTMFWLQNPPLDCRNQLGRALAYEEAVPSMLLPLLTVMTFDVALMLRESAKGIVGTCVYRPDILNPQAVDALIAGFKDVLEHIVLQPERRISTIPVLPLN
jgi:acyl-CoA synthetase (AMP-forming)/AMP-acid ligase II